MIHDAKWYIIFKQTITNHFHLNNHFPQTTTFQMNLVRQLHFGFSSTCSVSFSLVKVFDSISWVTGRESGSQMLQQLTS